MAEHLPTNVSATFADQLRAALEQARDLYDPDTGVHWRVYELPAGPFDRRTSPTLVFEQEAAMHRVRDYPDDWRALPPEELLALRRHR